MHDGVAGSSSADTALCLAYEKDRIAVSMPSGVKVWLLISGELSSLDIFLRFCSTDDISGLRYLAAAARDRKISCYCNQVCARWKRAHWGLS